MGIIDELKNYRVGTDLASWHPTICDRAADYIIVLLSRVEAAEARVRELETSFRTEKCENGPECAELGRVRKALAEAEARAEKAEKCISEIEEAIKFQRYSAAMLWISEYRGQKEE